MLRYLNRALYALERRLDRTKWRLRRWLGIGPVSVLAYDGYGSADQITALGRVLAGYDVRAAQDTDSVWRNLWNVVKRFRTRELPRVPVEVHFAGQSVRGTTDDEGQYSLTLTLSHPPAADRAWHDVTHCVQHPNTQRTVEAAGRVLIPPPNAAFGVISDLDDTVIQTDVLRAVEAARNTFLHNARTRLAFPGVAAFYRALQRGETDVWNPIFYVSNMPWNLYDLMIEFFDIQNIPRGPMFLTNLGLTSSHFVRQPGREHKREHIQRLLETYPDLPFILIGDSGEEDPQIYFETLKDYPRRIRAIYIRDVTPDRDQSALQALITEAYALQVDLLLVADTLAAAEHAAQHGWIERAALNNIRAEMMAAT